MYVCITISVKQLTCILSYRTDGLIITFSNRTEKTVKPYYRSRYSKAAKSYNRNKDNKGKRDCRNWRDKENKEVEGAMPSTQ